MPGWYAFSRTQQRNLILAWERRVRVEMKNGRIFQKLCPKVTGFLGEFWDGSCCFGGPRGWPQFNRKCEPVPGMNFLDAVFAGCSLLIESLNISFANGDSSVSL